MGIGTLYLTRSEKPEGGMVAGYPPFPLDNEQSFRIMIVTVRRHDVAKRTSLPCTPENCGDLFPRCGTTTTIYTKHKCRCDACFAVQQAAKKKWDSANQEHVKQYRAVYREENLESERERVRRWQEENREYTLEYAAQYRADKPEQTREATRKWRVDNPEKLKEYAQKYNKENREAIQAYQFNYRRENPEVHRAANHRRRARLKDAFVEDVNSLIVFERDNWTCQRCGAICSPDAKYPAADFATLDHIVALANGGLHSYENTQLLCAPCNSAKGNRE